MARTSRLFCTISSHCWEWGGGVPSGQISTGSGGVTLTPSQSRGSSQGGVAGR